MKLKPAIALTLILIAYATLTGCAPGPNELSGTPGDEGTVAGFWLGLWHGAIAPVTFVISLFRDNVQIYEVHNNGGWYNFGYVLGACVLFGGGGGASTRGSR